MTEDILDRRARAVSETVARVRAIETRAGVTRDALDEVKRELIALAERTELFPWGHFPLERPGSNVYRLAEDADRRFALYVSAAATGSRQPPHDHTTWAVIAGVHGGEHNVVFERTDDGSRPGRGTLGRDREVTVVCGTGVALMPDDFHTIEAVGGESRLNLHMYGRSLEDMPDRIVFEGSDGGAWRTFAPTAGIRHPVVSAAAVKEMLADGRELALLDVREEGVFGRGHMLLAASVPLSRLELGIDALVPRRTTRIVLVDGCEGLADRAARVLMHAGYTNLSVMAGGVDAWAGGGGEIYAGINVPSKAFGELVEHASGTPSIAAEDLKARIDAGEGLIILDSRPLPEFTRMSIPGGVDVPGAELVLRLESVAPEPGTTVVVNCAGRTRSIIGAQSLINAGVPNPVMALRNGTMGWQLAGFTLDHGRTRVAPKPGPDALVRARERAARVADRFGVAVIDRAGLDRFRAETDRTLYLFDVRAPEEFEAGHLAGSRSAPGGQLVQETDVYAATRGARIVLVDDDGVRARMTASWLVQMGCGEVFVVDGALEGADLEAGPAAASVIGLDRCRPETIGPRALQAALAAGRAVVVDLASSLEARDAHVPGAWFAVRAHLGQALERIPGREMLVLTSPDGVLATLAAGEAAALTDMAVRVLAGGTAAWRAANLPLDAGLENRASETDDVWSRPYDQAADVEQAMRDYLAWEVDLVKQIEREGVAPFRMLADA